MKIFSDIDLNGNVVRNVILRSAIIESRNGVPHDNTNGRIIFDRSDCKLKVLFRGHWYAFNNEEVVHSDLPEVDSTGYKPDTLVQRSGTSILTSGGFYESSDIRLKTDIENLEDQESLKIIENLSKVRYKLNSDGSQHIGLIAQEVESQYPEVIRVDQDGYKSINYPELISVAFSAISELSKELSELKKKLSDKTLD